MDQETGREPSLAEQERRSAVLAELGRRRRKRRRLVGLSVAVVGAVVASGSVVAWSGQARADSLARGIHTWHVDHERAGCELEVRIVSAVGLEQRTEDVLRAAEHVPNAEGLLGERERASFGAHRDALLRSFDDGGFVTDADRDLARAWEARAAAGDEKPLDVLAACLEEAAVERPALAEVTPEQVGELERELRALGDPRDFDDARIDRLEAALGQLEQTAVATAASRTELGVLEATFGLAPEQALASLRDAHAHIGELLEVVEGEHTPSDVLDLVESLALHVAAGWMAEAWQLEAVGQQEAANARAAAAEASRTAVAEAAPRPITDRAPVAPRPARPPLSQPPTQPVPPAPVDTTEPAAPGESGGPGQGTPAPDPGDGTTPPGDGTTPPGDGTTPPGEGTTPPGEGTTPPVAPGEDTLAPVVPGNGETAPPPLPIGP